MKRVIFNMVYMKKIGLFPVNNVIINMISLFWLVLSSAGAFGGAQEEDQPQIKASYPVMQSVKTASTISHSTRITKCEDIRQRQVEEVSVSKDTIEYAANAVKSICSEEPREYCRYKYIYYIGFIPKKSIKPTEVYYSQKERKLISTDELPDILVFIAHMYDEKTRYNHTGGSCHFYCDATTGEIIGYLHAM